MSSENKTGVSAKEHPMLNSLVLKTVFGHGDFVVGDLKSCRRVCSAWYDASVSSWSSSACVVLNGSGTSPRKYSANPCSEVFERYINYRTTFEKKSKLKYKPVINYKLQECIINEQNPWMQEFWTKFALTIETLTMEKCTFRRPSTFEDIVYSKTPNLERLVLSSNICGEETHDEYMERLERQQIYIPSFSKYQKQYEQLDQDEVYDLWLEEKRAVKWNRENPDETQPILKAIQIENEIPLTRRIPFAFFLAHFPGLEELVVKTWPVLHKHTEFAALQNTFLIENLLDNVQALRETDEERLNIKMLDIMDLGPLTTPYFDKFTCGRVPGGYSGHLPLEILHLDLGFQSLACILKIHETTLRVLKAFRTPYSKARYTSGEPALLNNTAQMSELKELHLYGDVVTTLRVLECMPNLEALTVERWCYSKRHKLAQHLDQNEKPFSDFADLVRNSVNEQWNWVLDTLKRFDSDVPPDAGSFQSLGRWIPNLKGLSVIVTNETLDLVTQTWPELTSLTLKFDSDVDDAGLEVLGRLKHLREFRLEAYCSKSTLTDKAGSMFASMEHLDTLTICVSKQMSAACEKRVKASKIGNVRFVRNYGRRDHGFDCCSRLAFHDATR